METEKPNVEEEQSWLGQGLRFLSVIAVCLALITYFYKLWEECRLPALATDSLIYHLTIPAQWLQRGLLRQIDLPFHDGAAEHSPLFMETVIYGLMRLTGDDTLAFFIQPAFFLLIVLMLHRCVRLLGLHAAGARFLAALVLLFPPFFYSSLAINSELVMTGGVAVFVFGMLLTRDKGEAGWYIAAGGIALTFATKTVGIIYGTGALVIFSIGLATTVVANGRNTLPSWKRTAGICAAIFLFGCAFHCRNLWEHGNPLYPAELRVFGLRMLPGRYNPSVFVNHGWSPQALSKMLLSDTADFSMNTQFGAALWLVMLVPLVMALRKKLTRADWLPMAMFVAYPLISVLIYFLVVPFWREHRLLFPVYYLLWGGMGWSLHLLTRERGELAREIAAAAAGLGFLAHGFFFLLHSQVPLLAFVGAAVLGLVVANDPRVLAWIWRRPWAIPAAALLLVAVGSPWWYPRLAMQRMKHRESSYSQENYYGALGTAWAGLDEHTSQQPATIAYTGTAYIYPLFGPRLANRVVYLPIHPHDQPAPLTLTKEPEIYRQLAEARRQEADENFWLGQLKAEHADYLVVVRDSKFNDPLVEKSFAAHHPELLRLILEAKDVWVYSVQRN